jgi:hypothetical protein
MALDCVEGGHEPVKDRGGQPFVVAHRASLSRGETPHGLWA